MCPPPPPGPNDGHRWQIIKDGDHGPISLYTNGNWSFGSMPFDQEIKLTDCPIGDSVVNKKAGVGGKITIKAPDQIHYLAFQSGLWFYRVEKRSLLARLFG